MCRVNRERAAKARQDLDRPRFVLTAYLPYGELDVKPKT